MQTDKALDSVSSDVIAANVEMYRSVAKNYDRGWNSVFGQDLDPALERDLNEIAAGFNSTEGPLRCLDCGAGTGAITLNMLERGWSVTALDVSSEMLSLLEKKIAERGRNAILINEPVERFLARPGPTYHLIGFNSVLHHLYRYAEVIDLAINRLAAGGFLYSNVDPVIPTRPLLTEVFDSFDTLLAKILHERSDLIPGTVRRLRKLIGKSDAAYGRKVATAGDLAEFHARSGVDDLELLRLLKARGLTIVEHSRYPMARTPATRSMNKLFKFRQEFKIIAQWPRNGSSRSNLGPSGLSD